MSNPIYDRRVKDVCKIGQGADCCRYLACGAKLFECLKHTSLKGELDRRVSEGSMTARGDNCEGVLNPPLQFH